MRIEIQPFNDRVSFTPLIQVMVVKPSRAVVRSGRVLLRRPLLPKIRGAINTDPR